MDRIELFRIFARVAEAESFTKAAATLNIPRSTVSTAIGELEARIGTRLLSRTTRQVTMTRDGHVFYEKCLRLIADVEEAEASFRRKGEAIGGKVHVDLPGRIGRLIVAPALPEFFRAYPNVEVQLGVSDKQVDLVSENVDCALRVGTLADSELIARHVGELRLVNAASPAYLERHGIPETPGQLATGHQVVGYASPTHGRLDDWEWVDGGGLRVMKVPAQVIVNSAEAYIACAVAGLGLIQIPAYDIQDHIARGALIEVMPDHRPASMPMTMLYPHRHHLSHRVQIFSEWLMALLKRDIRFD